MIPVLLLLLRVGVYLLILGGVAQTAAHHWFAWRRQRLVRELREATARQEAIPDDRA